MKKTSASSRSVAHEATNKRTTSRGTSKPLTITAAEFDRLADLPVDDPAGDLEPYIDHDKTRRPGRKVQRVNVDFPTAMLRAIDQEATRLGVTRQAFIKIRLADGLTSEIGRGRPQPAHRDMLAKLKAKIAREATAARAKKKHAKAT